MISRKLDLFLLVAAVAVTRFVFRSHSLYDLDSVNFALGMGHFDPRVHQPHPPGYFLYICLGWLLDFALHDVNLALVMVSILASCGVMFVIYYLTLDWFDQKAARFAGLLFLFSPLAWFHGIVALTYIVEAFFSVLLGYLCWRVYQGNHRYALPAAICLGVSAGVRPSSLLFLGPLFLFSLSKVRRKEMSLGVLALVATLAAWFLTMTAVGGGIQAYFGALLSLWQTVPSKGTIFNSSFATSIDRASMVVLIYFLAFGAASFAPMRWLHCRLPDDRKKKIFTAVWITPALCFFIFIFLKFVNSGYLLLMFPPLCIWLGFSLSQWYENSAKPRVFKLTTLAFCFAVNICAFISLPLYCSYRSIRQYEAEIQEIRTVLPRIAPASNTLIIGFDAHFFGFRQAGYSLPGYLTLEYPEVKLREGIRIFSMHERDTSLLTQLPADSSYSQLVFFPLPGQDADYKEYLRGIMKRLPPQSLRTVSQGGHDFVIGPISDLSLLFPGTAASK